MRNSVLLGLLLASTLIISTANGQQGAGIKADTAASKVSAHEAITTLTSEDASETQKPIPTIKIEKNVFSRTDSVPVAKWDGGELTNQEVSATLASRRPANLRTMGPEQFATLGHKQQVETVKQLAWEQILLGKARKSGIDETTPEVARFVKDQEEAALNRAYYSSKIADSIEKLTEKNARKFYDENPDQFTKPPITVIRAIHVSTYEMVTSEKGDTLKGLARSISGDASKAQEIRDAKSPFYFRDIRTEVSDKVLSSPLEAGEVLYVPMNEDAISSATEFAETLRSRLISGDSMDSLAGEMQKSDFTVSATQALRFSEEGGYWDEISNAVKDLKGTSVTDVIKTPSGLDVVVLEDQQTSEVVSFDSVKEAIISKLNSDSNERRQVIEETRKETIDRLWKKYNMQVNKEAVERKNYVGADPLTTDTVIAHSGDFKYTLEQYLTDLRLTGKDWGQLSFPERMDILKVASPVINYLIARDAREMGMDQEDDFKTMIKSITDSQIVAIYRKQNDDPNERNVTDEELRAFYTDHLDSYTSAAEVTIREISKRINMAVPPETKAGDIEKARKSLNEIKSRIHNKEEFIQLARRESEAISTRSRGGLIGTVAENFRGEAFKNQIRQLKVGEISEPFLYGSEVMIIRLDEREAPTVRPFEEVTRQVMMEYARTMPTKLRDQKINKALDAANFKLLF